MLTDETLMKLEAPFPLEDHKIRWDGNVYLTELPVIKRLTSVDLNWEFRITSTIVTDYNLTRPDCVTVSAELTICGITRAGVGSAIADVSTKDKQGKQLTTPIIRALGEKELKGAATDALKRCARQFGVGGYILRTKGVTIKNERDFANWYKREFGKPPPSELDDELDAPEPDARPRKLALETFPFNDSDKYLKWQDFIAKNPTWNKVFWPATVTLGLSNNDVHDALDVETTKDWDGGNVARLWLTLCEEKIALDDIAAQANES